MKKILKLRKNMYLNFLISVVIFIFLLLLSNFFDNKLSETVFIEYFGFTKTYVQSIIVMSIGLLITIITITFSSILVVLTLYSAQFSPRTLGDFLQRKVPINVLSYFAGASVFLVIKIIVVETSGLTYYPFTVFIVALIILIGIGLFIYYIQYVSKAIQISYYMENLVKDVINHINTYKEEIKKNPIICLDKNDNMKIEEPIEFISCRTGYFTGINAEKLMKILTENDLTLVLNIALNEYVYEGDVIFKYESKNSNYRLTEENLKEYFDFSEQIDNDNEVYTKSKKLLEIGVRALSPGINDPITAIECINHLSFILTNISDSFESLIYQDDKNVPRIKLKKIPFDIILYNHFYQLYLYGQQDLMVYSAIIRALSRIAKDKSNEIRKSIWDFHEYLSKDFDYKKLHYYDFKLINDELRELAYYCDKTSVIKDMK